MTNDRYQIGKIANMYGHDMWAVFDMNVLPFMPVKDERRDHATGRKKKQRFWKGNEQDAIHYCKLLNQAYTKIGWRARTELDEVSQSQRIHYRNNAEKRRRTHSIRQQFGNSDKGSTGYGSDDRTSRRSLGSGDSARNMAGPELRRRLRLSNDTGGEQERLDDQPPF